MVEKEKVVDKAKGKVVETRSHVAMDKSKEKAQQIDEMTVYLEDIQKPRYCIVLFVCVQSDCS